MYGDLAIRRVVNCLMLEQLLHCDSFDEEFKINNDL